MQKKIKKWLMIFLLIMAIPVKTNANSEPCLLMDSFVYESKIIYTTTKKKFVGLFEITAYCPCEYCCGKSDEKTASGRIAQAGRTIAADLQMFDFGDELIIDDHRYVVEDCGGAIKGNRIDMFFNSHSDAMDYGRRWVNVYREIDVTHVLRGVTVSEWLPATKEFLVDRTVAMITLYDGGIEIRNQAGDILACRYKLGNDEFGYFLKEEQ